MARTYGEDQIVSAPLYLSVIGVLRAAEKSCDKLFVDERLDLPIYDDASVRHERTATIWLSDGASTARTLDDVVSDLESTGEHVIRRGTYRVTRFRSPWTQVEFAYPHEWPSDGVEIRMKSEDQDRVTASLAILTRDLQKYVDLAKREAAEVESRAVTASTAAAQPPAAPASADSAWTRHPLFVGIVGPLAVLAIVALVGWLAHWF